MVREALRSGSARPGLQEIPTERALLKNGDELIAEIVRTAEMPSGAESPDASRMTLQRDSGRSPGERNPPDRPVGRFAGAALPVPIDNLWWLASSTI